MPRILGTEFIYIHISIIHSYLHFCSCFLRAFFLHTFLFNTNNFQKELTHSWAPEVTTATGQSRPERNCNEELLDNPNISRIVASL